jgi:hypothetical protein
MFSWFPPWVYLFIIPGFLLYAILAIALAKRMIVEIPVCDSHKRYWWKRNSLRFLSLLAVCGVAAVPLTIFWNSQGRAGAYVCLFIMALMIGWLILVAVLRLNMIRPSEITDRDITLKRVHQDFMNAFEQMERRSRRPRRRRDFDDDDFDRPIRRRAEPLDDDRRESFRADREDRPRDQRDTFRAESGDE